LLVFIGKHNLTNRVAVASGYFIAVESRAKKAALLFDRFVLFGMSSLRGEKGYRRAPGWDDCRPFAIAQFSLLNDRVRGGC
jgi:hypothetical protein